MTDEAPRADTPTPAPSDVLTLRYPLRKLREALENASDQATDLTLAEAVHQIALYEAVHEDTLTHAVARAVPATGALDRTLHALRAHAPGPLAACAARRLLHRFDTAPTDGARRLARVTLADDALGAIDERPPAARAHRRPS